MYFSEKNGTFPLKISNKYNFQQEYMVYPNLSSSFQFKYVLYLHISLFKAQKRCCIAVKDLIYWIPMHVAVKLVHEKFKTQFTFTLHCMYANKLSNDIGNSHDDRGTDVQFSEKKNLHHKMSFCMQILSEGRQENEPLYSLIESMPDSQWKSRENKIN